MKNSIFRESLSGVIVTLVATAMLAFIPSARHWLCGGLLERLASGHVGDVKPVGEGVGELRID